uniref:ATP synthase complex subunit 8 n=2 Tax=Strongylocentrotus TaxID=7664 RepID=Q85B86_STRPK|nr:ATP synthase F0 subunit 8 [Strongylocentrotus pallidus]ABV02420.1 ATP synthase F0 subunit 8 [Strongylocentrotus droebachiensis]AAP21722.1 ATPase 8 [Strongylocentrotus pallidus]AAP21725.1 ATPase 8 [Strongylocentrotus pallidus]AAP21728.1 ATPase 8 [Strongylocentrotus pallidus]AGS17185.1 ATP synthase subunit 8 [Strongylocentrotus pallidus]
MPQLEFTWWIINFFLIWVSVLIVIPLLLNSLPPNNASQSSSLTINKTTTNWQWL